jgi:hypothetical protein
MTYYRAIGASIVLAFLLVLPSAQETSHATPDEGSSISSPTQGEISEEGEKFGAWRSKFRVDAAGQKYTDLFLDAEQAYQTKNGDRLTPVLVLSCRKGSSIVYIDLVEPIGSQNDITVNLRYALDGSPATVEQWPLNKDRRLIVVPDANQFIQNLSGKKSLAFDILPLGLKRISAYFVLDNLDEVFILMTERCYK